MIIHMEKEIFDSLQDDAIGHACFAPMVPIYQNGMRGKSEQEAAVFRAEFLGSLSQGQRALFMFFTYYDHAIRSEGEMLRISQLYMTMQIFGAVKKAVEYFGDGAMLRLLEKIETRIGKNDELPLLHQELQELSPRTLVAIGMRIKENPADFEMLI